jgi:hypothetical protein
MAVNTPDRRGLLFGLSRVLEAAITIRPMALVEGAMKWGQQEREVLLDLVVPALPDGMRLLAEWATWLKQPEIVIEAGGACSR